MRWWLILLLLPGADATHEVHEAVGTEALRDVVWSTASGDRVGVDGAGTAIFSVEGYDGTHAELADCVDPDRLGAGFQWSPSPFVGPLPMPRNDESGHGDFIASVLCGRGEHAGMAPESTVFAMTGLCAEGCDFSEWYNDPRLHVVTSSVTDDPVRSAIQLGMPPDADLLFLQAVGNDGEGEESTTAPFLHSDPRLLGVAALDSAGHRMAAYSSRGDPADERTWPDLSAPGCMFGLVPPPWVDYYVTAQTNRLVQETSNRQDCVTVDLETVVAEAADQRVLHMGTSFATPVVAGVASLLWQVHPELTVADAIHILTRTADPFLDAPDLDGDGTTSPAEFRAEHGWQAGWGRINATGAVAAAHYLSMHASADAQEAVACHSLGGAPLRLNPDGRCSPEAAQAVAPVALTPTEQAEPDAAPSLEAQAPTPKVGLWMAGAAGLAAAAVVVVLRRRR